jgi:hypothetical protein
MVKLCIACTVSYSFLSLHNRKCGAEDLLMYAYRTIGIVLYCIPVNFRKRGEVGLRGLYKECTSLSPLPLCIVMFNLATG